LDGKWRSVNDLDGYSPNSLSSPHLFSRAAGKVALIERVPDQCLNERLAADVQLLGSDAELGKSAIPNGICFMLEWREATPLI
jgi:hypothetical protein